AFVPTEFPLSPFTRRRVAIGQPPGRRTSPPSDPGQEVPGRTDNRAGAVVKGAGDAAVEVVSRGMPSEEAAPVGDGTAPAYPWRDVGADRSTRERIRDSVDRFETDVDCFVATT